ncbi:MAG: hypothetical protein V3S70_09385 [Gammaproteobacteria bacterium]
MVASPHVVAGVQRNPAQWCLARWLPVPVVCTRQCSATADLWNLPKSDR